MPRISTRTHGIIDYVFAVVLIISPWLFGFTGGAAMWVPIAIGVAVLAQAVMTRYELGLVGVIPMQAHLMVDLAVGALLLISPWIFGFASEVWVPHVVLGAVALGTALATQRAPTASHGRVA